MELSLTVKKSGNSKPDLRREYQVDSEVILALLRKFLREHGSIIKAAQKIFAAIQGTASIALLFRDFAATINSFQWVYR
jgi:glucosamine 6-phosphate synthetase-like amidotransferase/phosphosugar isomerase protein